MQEGSSESTPLGFMGKTPTNFTKPDYMVILGLSLCLVDIIFFCIPLCRIRVRAFSFFFFLGGGGGGGGGFQYSFLFDHRLLSPFCFCIVVLPSYSFFVTQTLNLRFVAAVPYFAWS
jgi:hypothetical protein